MTKIRRRKPRYEFVQILNAVARDYRVSWRARGLLVELLSYPADYETTVDDLVQKAKRLGGQVEGRDAMRKAARELEAVGYIVRTRYQDERGRWRTDLEITDDPMYDLLAKDGVSPGRTDDGKPGVGKPAVGKPGVIKKTEKKTEKKILPPSPPSVRRDARRGVGTEDESAAKNTNIDGQGDDDGAAAALVADAIRRWHSDHAAPNARDRARLVARVRAELTTGGDPVVILHELTRDLHPSQAGSAVKVIMGARTREPGWGRADDPRPDHSRHEVRTKTPWCGRCDERTRLVVALGADGDERMRRCPDCHPERATDAPESPAGAVPSPPPLNDLMRDLNGSGVSGAGHDDGSDDDGGTGSARSLPAAVAEVRALLERQRATV